MKVYAYTSAQHISVCVCVCLLLHVTAIQCLVSPRKTNEEKLFQHLFTFF